MLAALDYVLSLEADAPGRAGRGGHWPVMCRLGGGGGDGGDDGDGDDDRALVHWCHGAPGVAMTMAKAFESTRADRFREAAVRAGEHVWERGLLRKGPGLCHGVSGNGYALLAVWRATRDPVWLQRARRFAAFVAEDPGGRADWAAPDHPYSLFEGLGGALCLLSDLAVDPEGARFPFYEV